ITREDAAEIGEILLMQRRIDEAEGELERVEIFETEFGARAGEHDLDRIARHQAWQEEIDGGGGEDSRQIERQPPQQKGHGDVSLTVGGLVVRILRLPPP